MHACVCRVAVKSITKRIMAGCLETNFVRRVQHEVRYARRAAQRAVRSSVVQTVCGDVGCGARDDPHVHVHGGAVLQVHSPPPIVAWGACTRAQVDIYTHVGRSLSVAHLYGAFEDPTHVQLVLELCTGEPPHSHSHSQRGMHACITIAQGRAAASEVEVEVEALCAKEAPAPAHAHAYTVTVAASAYAHQAGGFAVGACICGCCRGRHACRCACGPTCVCVYSRRARHQPLGRPTFASGCMHAC